VAGGSFDSTAVDATTWSDGANASNIWTFNVSGVDPTLTWGSQAASFSGNFTAAGFITPGAVVIGTASASNGYVDIYSASHAFAASLYASASMGGDETFTLPAAGGVLAASSAALTTGRVPYATTGGALTDEAAFTYDGATNTLGVDAVTATTGNIGSLVFEGATVDANDTSLTVVDPTGVRTWTLPDATDTVVGKATTDTLTNKTLTAPVINGAVTGTITVPAEAYDATGWNGDDGPATKNDVRDKIETLSSGSTPTINGFRQNVFLWEEFFGVMPSSGPYGVFAVTRTVANSGGTTSGPIGATDAAPGVFGMFTVTSTTSAAGIITGQPVLLGNGAYTFETRVQVDDLSDATNAYTIRTGFLDSITGEPTDGCYFRYSDADASWFTVCRSNGVETASAVDSATDVAADTWDVLRVEVNAAATSVVFKIDGATVRTETANIPTGASRQTYFGSSMIRSAGTVSRALWSDYIGLEIALTASR